MLILEHSYCKDGSYANMDVYVQYNTNYNSNRIYLLNLTYYFKSLYEKAINYNSQCNME